MSNFFTYVVMNVYLFFMVLDIFALMLGLFMIMINENVVFGSFLTFASVALGYYATRSISDPNFIYRINFRDLKDYYEFDL
jgi:hypothetical protein